VTTEGLRDLLGFAVEVAWRAGRTTLTHFQTGIAAETKPDRSPVTAADRTAEQLARDLIRARFPHDGIVGEEFGVERAGMARRWILDPIDGTRSFVRGVPLYGVLIALEDEGEPVVGVAHFPALEETVCAARGLGCWWNGRRALVSDVTRLEDALALTTSAALAVRQGRGEGWARLCAHVGTCRTWGDCYGYALVATGRAEVMVDPSLAVWDAAAVRTIVEEAGGVVTDWDGVADHRNGSLVATNAALSNEIRRLLQGRET
jgi:histidinol phosphatase-like enzyme (inositol monophosphatase family)